MKPIVLPYRGVRPEIHPSAFVAPGAGRSFTVGMRYEWR